jgi:hypothetical protein
VLKGLPRLDLGQVGSSTLPSSIAVEIDNVSDVDPEFSHVLVERLASGNCDEWKELLVNLSLDTPLESVCQAARSTGSELVLRAGPKRDESAREPDHGSGTSAGVIVGATVGGVVGFAGIVAGAIYLWTHLKRSPVQAE